MKYDLRLSNGLNAEVESDRNEEDFTTALRTGMWLKDKYGWTINPAHVVLFEPIETEEDNEALPRR